MMDAAPWRSDSTYGGMSDHAARKSWEAAQERLREVQRIYLVPFDEIKLSLTRRYLVKGILPRIGIGVIWGIPKCGKSFWIFDLLMHVALGWMYRGRRVHQGVVVYCCFEGQSGFQARKEAFCLRFLEGYSEAVPFFLMPVTLDLIKDHPALIKAIRETLGEKIPVAVALDTLNRSLVGSENDAADMSAYIRAADTIREVFECVVPIVHHCGHDGKRPRGHSGLGGALEFQMQVSRDAANHIITEMELEKDGPADAKIISSLEVVSVGTDEDGEEITSCVIVPSDAEVKQKASVLKLTGANQKLMFRILHSAGAAGLTQEDWYAKARDDGITKTPRLSETRNDLVDKGMVREVGGRWSVAQ
jgi:hypothetical protein